MSNRSKTYVMWISGDLVPPPWFGMNSKKKPCSIELQGFCTRSGGRTRTAITGHRILSPACLPIPPSEQPFKKKPPATDERKKRARNETRTRDPNLGKVVLYQLSYSRIPASLEVDDKIKRFFNRVKSCPIFFYA